MTLALIALTGLTLIGVGLAAADGGYIGRPPKLPPPRRPPPSRPRPPPSGSKVRLVLDGDAVQAAMDRQRERKPPHLRGTPFDAVAHGMPHPLHVVNSATSRHLAENRAAFQAGVDGLERERVEAIEGMHLALILMDEVTAALGRQQYGLACRHLRCGPEVYRLLPLSSIGPARTAIWRGVEVIEMECMVGWSLCDGDCPLPAREPWATERPGRNLRWG